MILGLNLEFITHIKQSLTKEKAGKSVAHTKRRVVSPSSERGSGKRMHRSKLKICIEILCSLASNGPMKLTQLMTKVELNKTRLRQHLRLLKKRDLVERQNFGENKIFYVVTERGLEVLKVIGPIIREARKIQALQF
jgi:predicted transcriptional regulator